MKPYALALAALMASPLTAQTHYSVGLLTTNGLATEQTHRVRLTSLPGALYIGVTIDGRQWEQLGVTTTANLVLSPLQIEKCSETPCSDIPPYDWRPTAKGELKEYPFWLLDLATGLRYRLGDADVALGVAHPIAVCPYQQCGASPMLIFGGYGDARVKVRLLGVRVGITAGMSVLPPQPARWTVLSEMSGMKQNGHPFPNGKNDPHTVHFYRLGLTVER